MTYIVMDIFVSFMTVVIREDTLVQTVHPPYQKTDFPFRDDSKDGNTILDRKTLLGRTLTI